MFCSSTPTYLISVNQKKNLQNGGKDTKVDIEDNSSITFSRGVFTLLVYSLRSTRISKRIETHAHLIFCNTLQSNTGTTNVQPITSVFVFLTGNFCKNKGLYRLLFSKTFIIKQFIFLRTY